MIDEMDAPTEDESERNGFLSYAGEWHAATIGIGVGLAAALHGRPEFLAVLVATTLGLAGADRLKGRRTARELRREPWYGIGASLLAYVVGVAIW